MQHLEKEYVPRVCVSFHTWKSKDLRLNRFLLDKLWKFGLMFSKPEICGWYLGPVDKGDLSASSTAADSRGKVVQDAECWTCIGVGWFYFSGDVKQLKPLLEVLLCCETDLPFYPTDFQSNCQSYSSGLTCSYRALTFLSVWSLIRLSHLLPVHQDPIKQIKLFF